MSLVLVITIVATALIFDFLNGFHDAANSIATIVATKVLTPFKAVLWAATFNFVAPFIFGIKVADSISKTVKSSLFKPEELAMIVLAGLVGAVIWNLITWYIALPTSSSHALIGGLSGAGLMAGHMLHGSTAGVLNWPKIIEIAIFIVLSPLLGMILGFIDMVLVMHIFRRTSPHKVDGAFRKLQLLSAAAYSLGHGTNDAQKTMGVIGLIMAAYGGSLSTAMANGKAPLHIDPWIIMACATAIALGTMSGGWRIVKTMGLGITKLKPVGGFCAETAGAITLMGVTHLGVPVSTTHTITGAIVGVGATNRLSAVRWGVAGRIVWAWVLTMPLAALMSSLVYALIHVLSR